MTAVAGLRLLARPLIFAQAPGKARPYVIRDDFHTVGTAATDDAAGTDDGPGPIDDGNPGCYDVSIHECDCSIMSEEDCPAPMVWTSGCASCAGGDDGGDESDSATRAVLAAAAVVAALVF